MVTSLGTARRAAYDIGALHGIDVRIVCLSTEFDEQLANAKKSVRRFGFCDEKFQEDEERLFSIVQTVWKDTQKTNTMADVAAAVVDAYMKHGMDIDQVIHFVKTEDFAVGMANLD